jgi:hypothetical protein
MFGRPRSVSCLFFSFPLSNLTAMQKNRGKKGEEEGTLFAVLEKRGPADVAGTSHMGASSPRFCEVIFVITLSLCIYSTDVGHGAQDWWKAAAAVGPLGAGDSPTAQPVHPCVEFEQQRDTGNPFHWSQAGDLRVRWSLMLSFTPFTLQVKSGPATFVRQDHEKVVLPPTMCINIPPRRYCVVANPHVRNKNGQPLEIEINGVKTGQVCTSDFLLVSHTLPPPTNGDSRSRRRFAFATVRPRSACMRIGRTRLCSTLVKA